MLEHRQLFLVCGQKAKSQLDQSSDIEQLVEQLL